MTDDLEYLVAHFWGEYARENYDAIVTEDAAGKPHSGDCTHECHTCQRCAVAEIRKEAEPFRALIRSARAEGFRAGVEHCICRIWDSEHARSTWRQIIGDPCKRVSTTPPQESA